MQTIMKLISQQLTFLESILSPTWLLFLLPGTTFSSFWAHLAHYFSAPPSKQILSQGLCVHTKIIVEIDLRSPPPLLGHKSPKMREEYQHLTFPLFSLMYCFIFIPFLFFVNLDAVFKLKRLENNYKNLSLVGKDRTCRVNKYYGK